MEYLSARKFAALVGVSNVQISKLVKQGRLPVNDKGQIPKDDGLIAFEASKRLGYENNRAHNAKVRATNAEKKSPKKERSAAKVDSDSEPMESSGDDEGLAPIEGMGAEAARIALIFNKAKADRAVSDAKITQMKEMQMAGQLVERSLVYAEGADVATRTKEILDAMPARLGPQCEGKTAAEIQGIIYDALQVAYGHINGLIKQGQSEQE